MNFASLSSVEVYDLRGDTHLLVYEPNRWEFIVFGRVRRRFRYML